MVPLQPRPKKALRKTTTTESKNAQVLQVVFRNQLNLKEIHDTQVSGHYENCGTHFERPTFLKTSEGLSKRAFVYYWDSRDGADQAGWWIGSSIGGEDVFAHNPSADLVPPGEGWMILSPCEKNEEVVVRVLDGEKEPAVEEPLSPLTEERDATNFSLRSLGGAKEAVNEEAANDDMVMCESSEEESPPSYILPLPWEAVLDPDTGVYYFWNPDTEESTWEPPEGAIPMSESQSPTEETGSQDADAAAGPDGESNYRMRPRPTKYHSPKKEGGRT